MKEPYGNDNPWKAAALVSVISADIVVCTFGGYFAGEYIGGLLGGGSLWSIVGLSLGLVIGAVSIIFLIKYYTKG